MLGELGTKSLKIWRDNMITIIVPSWLVYIFIGISCLTIYFNFMSIKLNKLIEKQKIENNSLHEQLNDKIIDLLVKNLEK